MQIRPGYIQTLPYYDATERGFLLGDDNETVFITKYEAPKDFNEGDSLEVFVFYNEDKEREATTKLPEIQVGQVGCFRVRGVNDIGAFVNIGTRRDIFIPKREQLEPLEVDRMTLIILCEDTENERLFATTKLNRMMQKDTPPYQRGDEVQLMIAEKIEIGRRVIVDGKYLGALFRQEMTDRVRLGEKVKGYVRRVEGKDITVSMQREGMELLEDAKVKLMAYLEMNGGYARLNDDTDPEEIKLRLKLSKKTFKKAAGMLFKEGKVLLTKFGVKINKSGEIPKEWEGKRTWVDEDDAPESKKPYKKHHEDDEEDRKPSRSGDSRGRDSKENKRPFSDREARNNDRKSSYPKDRERKDYSKKSYSDKPREPREAKSDYPKKSYSEKPRERKSEDRENTDSKPKKQLTFKGKK